MQTFAAGGGCGFLAGALLVLIVLWQFHFIGPASTRSTIEAADSGPAVLQPALETPSSTMGRDKPKPAAPDPAFSGDQDAPDLKERDLLIPVEGVKADDLNRDFTDLRGGSRQHEAIDILAPRDTPVRAVENGTIARLFYSKAGGITVYQFDPSVTYCYYYAHLERYAEGIREGIKVRKGDVLGYVGTSGNAPKNTPHLHFAIFRLTDEKHWWEGTPIDPYEVLR